MQTEYHLRPLKLEDAARMLEWMHDQELTRYLKLDGKNASMETVTKFILEAQEESAHVHRAVVDNNDVYFGTVSLKNIDRKNGDAEYAIALHPAALGSGAATEATRQILRIAFQQLGLNRVYLNVLEENRRAVKFYEKFGFDYYDKTGVNFLNNKKILLWYEILKDEKEKYF